ncbi:MAG: hypothetical protein CME65_15325 [Halobacteriovoraceae bacterium]|nr:hypothetical protein [Halobacteriovoraceae bacterium]|tara:strand:- start:7882 stop:8631 length:750 start_codon:yes stop_codon:yes gene_type:complete
MERILVLILLLISFQAQAISIISDLDDTLKITNVENKPQALWNALFNRAAFKGMPELIEDYSTAGGDLFVVSASPNLFEKPIEDFFSKNEVSVKQLYTRKLSQLGQKEAYKLESLRDILTRYPGEYLLWGDDVEIDADVYAKIKEEFPSQIKAIYIHQINGHKDLPGTKFYTAFDIAVAEYKAGRISSLELLDKAKDFLLIRDMEAVFPKFKFCPTEQSVFETDLPFIVRTAAKSVYTKITNFCQSRDG